MKKWLSLLLSAVLLVVNVPALADSFTMAGFDSVSVNHDWVNNLFFRRMEERTGVKLAFEQYTALNEWSQVKGGYTAGASMPDVLFKAELTVEETLRLYNNGALIDLRPYMGENTPNLTALFDQHPEWKQAVTLPDGAIVALPYLNTIQNNNAIWINTKWLDNVGMAMPTTANELTQVLRAFRDRDPNRNARRDEKPVTFTGMWDLRFLAHAFGIYSNDYYVAVENGTVFETVTSDANRQFLAWLHQLWQENLIDHDGFSSSDSSRKISSNNDEIIYGVVFGPSIMQMLPAEQVKNYAVLQPLTYQGKQVYRKLLSDVGRGTFAITSSCKDPAALMAWVDFLYSEEGCFLSHAGMENQEYRRYADGTWEWMDDAKRVAEQVLPDVTIADGGLTPGYVPESYQLNYSDASIHDNAQMLFELANKSVEPYPSVYMDAADRARIAELWQQIGPYAENTMARFVTGDVPLNDETWQEFCNHLNALGLPETVALWQKALD